jgi:hypothetical protein
MLASDTQDRDRKARASAVTKRLAALERELENLADLAARGGAVPAILDAVTDSLREIIESNGAEFRSGRYGVPNWGCAGVDTRSVGRNESRVGR